jgi:hypothetical protein
MSRPLIIMGIADSWIGVGFTNPIKEMASFIWLLKPKSSKFTEILS